MSDEEGEKYERTAGAIVEVAPHTDRAVTPTPSPATVTPPQPEVVSPSAPPDGRVSMTALRASAEVRVSRGVMTDPRSLGEYEKSCPGAAEKILANFFASTQLEQEHRRKMECSEFEAEKAHNDRLMNQGDRAQYLGFIIVIAGLALAGYCLHKEQWATALAIVTVTLGSIATTFIYGRKKQAEEAKQAAEPKLPASKATEVTQETAAAPTSNGAITKR